MAALHDYVLHGIKRISGKRKGKNMWIKFDGKQCVVKLSKNLQQKATFTVNKWVHIVETSGKLYIDGKELKDKDQADR